MVGTAAEVTPIREVDDHLVGRSGARDARDPAGVPRHGARTQRPVGAVARVRAGHEAGVKQEVRPVPLSGPFLDEREEELVLEVMRSGRLSLGPTVDRFEELFAEAVGAPYAAAVSSGTAGLHLLSVAAGIAPGDEVITSPYSFAALGELLRLRGRRAGLRGRRSAHAEPRPGGGRGGGDAADEGDRRGRHLRLPVRARAAPRDRRAPRARPDRGLLRGARRRVRRRPDRLARPVVRVRLLREQADHDRRGRDGDDALRGGVAAAPLAPQPGARRLRRVARARAARVQLPPRRHRRRDGDRPGREARPDPRASRLRREALCRALAGHPRRGAAVRGRRRARALVVRLRRRACRTARRASA